MKTYFEKLRDPRWQRIRLKVMEIADFKCQDCGDSQSTLNVHHKVYLRGCEPWDYPLNYYVCCCESCHRTREEIATKSRFIFQCIEPDVAKEICDFLLDRIDARALDWKLYEAIKDRLRDFESSTESDCVVEGLVNG